MLAFAGCDTSNAGPVIIADSAPKAAVDDERLTATDAFVVEQVSAAPSRSMLHDLPALPGVTPTTFNSGVHAPPPLNHAAEGDVFDPPALIDEDNDLVIPPDTSICGVAAVQSGQAGCADPTTAAAATAAAEDAHAFVDANAVGVGQEQDTDATFEFSELVEEFGDFGPPHEPVVFEDEQNRPGYIGKSDFRLGDPDQPRMPQGDFVISRSTLREGMRTFIPATKFQTLPLQFQRFDKTLRIVVKSDARIWWLDVPQDFQAERPMTLEAPYSGMLRILNWLKPTAGPMVFKYSFVDGYVAIGTTEGETHMKCRVPKETWAIPVEAQHIGNGVQVDPRAVRRAALLVAPFAALRPQDKAIEKTIWLANGRGESLSTLGACRAGKLGDWPITTNIERQHAGDFGRALLALIPTETYFHVVGDAHVFTDGIAGYAYRPWNHTWHDLDKGFLRHPLNAHEMDIKLLRSALTRLDMCTKPKEDVAVEFQFDQDELSLSAKGSAGFGHATIPTWSHDWTDATEDGQPAIDPPTAKIRVSMASMMTALYTVTTTETIVLSLRQGRRQPAGMTMSVCSTEFDFEAYAFAQQ